MTTTADTNTQGARLRFTTQEHKNPEQTTVYHKIAVSDNSKTTAPSRHPHQSNIKNDTGSTLRNR